MFKFLFTAIVLMTAVSVSAQTIQWNESLLPADVTRVANDSTEKGSMIFRSRLFLLDSIQDISKKTGVPFFDNGYSATFKSAQEINHLVINFKNASRLIYYIRLLDEQNGWHMVYNYGAIHPCEAQSESLLLTIAHTPYKVKKVEIGTFLSKDDVIKVGISNEPDGNKVIQSLLSQRLTALCIKTSFLNEKFLLHPGINSATDEVKPVISPDGRTLYFHRQNFKGNVGGKKDDQDIYVSRNQNNNWTDAENMKAPLNDNLPNGIASVSAGETTLFLINEYISSNQQRQGLSVSDKTISGWSFPKKIEVKNFYNRSPFMDFFISPTQNEMILAIQRDDSYGDQDLYVSFIDDVTGIWTEPVNLGSEVNSFLSEASPFLASDGKTLYFASDGQLGYGGFDIYVTHRLDDSWINWSVPENLGPIVNSFDHDLYYTVAAAGDQCYFVSTTNGDRNIFRMALPTIYKPEPVVLLSGKIFDPITILPVEADIKITWHDDDETISNGKSDPVTGEYKVILPAGGVYDYKITKTGFKSITGTVSTLTSKSYEEKEVNLHLVPTDSVIERKTELPFSLLDSDSLWQETLANAAMFLRAFPAYNAILRGSFPLHAAQRKFKSLDDLRMKLVEFGAPFRKISIQRGDSSSVSLSLISTSVAEKRDDLIVPDTYVRPIKFETNDVSVLVRGKVIDASTLKPIGGRILFKVNEKIKSRATSDPVSGKFQALLPSNVLTSASILYDSVQFTVNVKTPESKQYAEFENFLFVNVNDKATPRFTLGNDISTNRDEASTRKWNSFLRKKKASKQVLKLKVSSVPIPERFEKDLSYILELMRNSPTMNVTFKIHSSSRVKASGTQEQLVVRLQSYVEDKKGDKSRIKVEMLGANEPQMKNSKHYANNRIEVEVTFK